MGVERGVRKRHFQLIIRSILYSRIYLRQCIQHDVVLMLKTKYLFNKGCFLYIIFYAEYNIKFTYIMLYIFRIPTLYMWMCVTLRMHLKHNIKRAVLETPPGIFGRMRSLSKIYFHVCDFECRIIFTSMLSSISMYQQH